MNIKDKMIISGVKALEDSYINSGFVDMFKEKIKTFNSVPGLSTLTAPLNSAFNFIKSLIGPFLNKFTNSFDIINSNKEQFFSKITGVDKIPEDLLP